MFTKILFLLLRLQKRYRDLELNYVLYNSKSSENRVSVFTASRVLSNFFE